ncbi:hypothetical protein ABZ733_06730 [Streptomyces longwoodensis]|uniref:hypothetical protein n=1 Tax=Streptomyces longwoodensis TaxID=68231 RepID=UPI0033D64122
MSEPITNLTDAVRELGALPVPVGPQMPEFPPPPRTELEKLHAERARLQNLLAEAVADKHRAQRERDAMRDRVSEPYGCQHCGTPQREHGRRWLSSVGMHGWVAPSQEQVAERMRARRTVRLAARAAELGRLRAHVEALLEERHRTNEWADDAAKALRRQRDRITELETAQAFVYRAEHPDSGIVLGTYSKREAAAAHCEALARREGATGLVSWVPDDSDALSPEELTFFDVEYCDGDDVPAQTCTGYVITPLEVASEYDAGAEE